CLCPMFTLGAKLPSEVSPGLILMVSYLHGIRGKDGKENIIHMVQPLISKEVTQKYSFLGKKEVLRGTKICKLNTVAARKLALTEKKVSSAVGNSLQFS
ncbi:unnamed protein product, partial [Darwinula stevensoni]